VAVPEAAMNENRGLAGGENKVRLPRQCACVQPVPVAPGMEAPPDDHLGLSVSTANPGHHPATGRGIYDIRRHGGSPHEDGCWNKIWSHMTGYGLSNRDHYSVSKLTVSLCI